MNRVRPVALQTFELYVTTLDSLLQSPEYKQIVRDDYRMPFRNTFALVSGWGLVGLKMFVVSAGFTLKSPVILKVNLSST
jgi:hypothetical protein